ncbi:MAG: argininosuccinate lyase [Chloroflexi bacterium]|nr:argininosuccinate lyase [Chloroflexota bacterium]
MSDFPHPAYAANVLRPSFDLARRHLFAPMMAANKAHVVMLVERGILAHEAGCALLRAIQQVEAEGAEAYRYQPGVEDLFFAVEGRLMERAGPEVGGNLQLARSRNDLGAALQRMVLRERLLRLGDRLSDLRRVLLALAGRHLETIMPGHTHYQPAQPTTMAHYLAGVATVLARDFERVRHAYGTTNRSPLGCVAFTTTGFPIDRRRVAELLGFDGLLPNGQDAIGAADHMAEASTVCLILASHLSRLTRDLLFWATQEAGAIRIHDSFIQISSIMPQKRNPVVLEHLRARLGAVYGYVQAIVVQAHNVPYGDTQDIEDEMLAPVVYLFETMEGVLELYTAVMETVEVDRDRLRRRAADGFTTATELADVLVREYGLPFRTAHAVVGRMVRQALARGVRPAEVTPGLLDEAAREVLGRPLEMDAGMLREALDPEHFVRVRSVEGGPAPDAMERALSGLEAGLQEDRHWLAERRAALAAADRALGQAVEQLCVRAGSVGVGSGYGGSGMSETGG